MPAIKLDHDTEIVVTRGREAWRTLRSDETWEKWVAIGRAIEAGKTAIMRLLHTNQPKGKAWSQTFGAWLAENDFDQIDKGVRSRLQDCLDNLPAIEAWRQTLGLTQRLQLNHPNAVLRRFQASRQAPAKGGSSGRPGLREEVIRLQSELDGAHREIERLRRSLDDGNDFDWQDKPEDIARAMLERFPTKAARIAGAILNQSKSTAPKPRQQQKAAADPDAKLARHLWPTPNKPR
jgi:hypothetical protein